MYLEADGSMLLLVATVMDLIPTELCYTAWKQLYSSTLTDAQTYTPSICKALRFLWWSSGSSQQGTPNTSRVLGSVTPIITNTTLSAK